jgi:hypothetical protein
LSIFLVAGLMVAVIPQFMPLELLLLLLSIYGLVVVVLLLMYAVL